MTATLDAYLNLAPDLRPRTDPWCLWCAGLLNVGDHEGCRSNLDGSLWTPCLTCNGGRADMDGTSCADCLGVGFWEYGSLEAVAGGFTVLDEVDPDPELR